MKSDTRFQWNHLYATGGASTSYFRVPYRCTLRDFQATCQGDPGDAQTLTLTENSAGTALGVLTFGTDIAAGAIGTWAADSTTGDHVLEKDEIIKVTGSTATAAVNATIDCELDPYARS